MKYTKYDFFIVVDFNDDNSIDRFFISTNKLVTVGMRKCFKYGQSLVDSTNTFDYGYCLNDGYTIDNLRESFKERKADALEEN